MRTALRIAVSAGVAGLCAVTLWIAVGSGDDASPRAGGAMMRLRRTAVSGYAAVSDAKSRLRTRGLTMEHAPLAAMPAGPDEPKAIAARLDAGEGESAADGTSEADSRDERTRDSALQPLGALAIRLDPPAVDADAVTSLLTGHDPFGPRRLVLWRVRGERRAQLATGESTASGRLLFPPIPAVATSDRLLVTPLGVTPRPGMRTQPTPRSLASTAAVDVAARGALGERLARVLGVVGVDERVLIESELSFAMSPAETNEGELR